MEAWIIILAIVLLRGLGAWMRRRQEKQRREEAEASGGKTQPEPGDPDAFDFEEPDPFGNEEFPWEVPERRRPPQPQPTRRQRPEPTRRQRPEPRRRQRPEPTRRLPDGSPPMSYEDDIPPEVVVLSDEERRRQETLQRLAQAASEAARETRHALSSGVLPARRPQSEAASISHQAERAQALRRMLASRPRVREALVLREVLGPPVALRGPLRGRGPASLQPR